VYDISNLITYGTQIQGEDNRRLDGVIEFGKLEDLAN
jgi:hypothetical protein